MYCTCCPATIAHCWRLEYSILNFTVLHCSQFNCHFTTRHTRGTRSHKHLMNFQSSYSLRIYKRHLPSLNSLYHQRNGFEEFRDFFFFKYPVQILSISILQANLILKIFLGQWRNVGAKNLKRPILAFPIKMTKVSTHKDYLIKLSFLLRLTPYGLPRAVENKQLALAFAQRPKSS